MDDVLLALKNFETRLNMALDACIQAAADLDDVRAKNGLPPATPLFVLASEHRAALAARLAEKPSPPPPPEKPKPRYTWTKGSASGRDPGIGLSVIIAASKHPGLQRPDDLEWVAECMSKLHGDVEAGSARAAEATGWADLLAHRLATVEAEASGTVPPPPPAPVPEPSVPVEMSAAEIHRCAEIAAGRITPLPVDRGAREIIRAAAKARNQKDPTL